MSKPRIPNQRRANLEHKKRVERYAVLIQQVYDKMALESARLASLAGADPETQFSFKDYPLTKEAIKKLQAQLRNDVQGIVMSGISSEWKESNLVQDLVVKKVLTAYTGTSKYGDEFTRYFQTNPDALKAFQERKEEGMNLSTRVWNLSEQYKGELEEAITAAIAPGTSAMELAAQVKQYLKEPDKRFRRIKEKMEDGKFKWQLSNPAKAYHPGQGVYRSSARNAQRLARTEINMAYRTAEQTRWKQFDFVVGYEVHTTQNGHHVEDICDQLAGKYPKDFVFKGWHPQCMCYTIPILKTEEEFWSLDDTKSVNEITEVPENFREWIKDNTDRIEKAEARGTLPYFIKDNRGFVEEVLDKDVAKQPEITRIETNRREYNLLGLEWEKVCFNEKTGGYNVYHESHQFAPQKAEKIVDGRKIKSKLSGGDAEKYVGRILCDLNGKCVKFLAENGKSQGKPDIEFDGETWDIKYIPLANENTIRKYIKDAEKAQNVIFFWDGEDRKNSLYNAVNSELGNYRKKGKIDRMPKVYYISLEGKLKKLNVQT